MKIYESAEDYLETILMFCEQHGSARSVDIAAHLAVHLNHAVYHSQRRPQLQGRSAPGCQCRAAASFI